MATVTVSFTLNDRKDADLIKWLDAQPGRERSEAIRATLRLGLARGGVTIGDVYQVVKAIDRKLARGVVAVGAPTGEAPTDWPDDEPPAAVEALAGLGKL